MPTHSLKKISKNTRGFISLVAIGIFAMLSLFGIIVQLSVVDTINAVRNTTNYYQARDVADSIAEFTQFELNTRESGYNESFTCLYGDFNPTGDNPDQCDDFDVLVGNRDTSIDVVIKGRADDSETFNSSTNCAGLPGESSCVVVPTPETGSAGERCNLYDAFNSQEIVDSTITGFDTDVNHVNYSCNWNRLSFGSSTTDRVTIPLYFQDADHIESQPPDDLVHPFFDDGFGSLGDNWVLKIRTPCKPCAPAGASSIPSWQRDCTDYPNVDPTVCSDSDRYVLKDVTNGNESDDIIAQWQLTAQCPDGAGGFDECGLVPYLGVNPITQVPVPAHSGILESKINTSDHFVASLKDGINTTTYDQAGLFDFLNIADRPKLTFFLTANLVSEEDKLIPYLEYQLLSDITVADAKTQMDVTVNIDGNIFEKKLSRQETKTLIDFAVQN